MVATVSELRKFVRERLRLADTVAKAIRLSEERVEKYSLNARAASIASIPRISELEHGYGVKASAVIVFADLRDSTKKAAESDARTTYLTIHALLPTLALLVSKSSGRVVNFRGDGLFAAFGIDEAGENPEGMDLGVQAQLAGCCGKAMIEATSLVVEPELNEYGIEPRLVIGVGISCGPLVITHVGFDDAYEITAYGNCVNQAAKLCAKGHNEIFVTQGIKDIYPEGKGGKAGFRNHSLHNLIQLVFADDYCVLRKSPNSVKKVS